MSTNAVPAAAGYVYAGMADLAVINCGECGGVYAINEKYRKQKREQSGRWTCPYCGTGWGFGIGEIERVRRRLANAEDNLSRSRARHQTTQRRLSATQGVVTRTKNRIRNGVCPCCNRHFENLEKHMGRQHPEYGT